MNKFIFPMLMFIIVGCGVFVFYINKYDPANKSIAVVYNILGVISIMMAGAFIAQLFNYEFI